MQFIYKINHTYFINKNPDEKPARELVPELIKAEKNFENGKRQTMTNNVYQIFQNLDFKQIDAWNELNQLAQEYKSADSKRRGQISRQVTREKLTDKLYEGISDEIKRVYDLTPGLKPGVGLVNVAYQFTIERHFFDHPYVDHYIAFRSMLSGQKMILNLPILEQAVHSVSKKFLADTIIKENYYHNNTLGTDIYYHKPLLKEDIAYLEAHTSWKAVPDLVILKPSDWSPYYD